MADGDRKQDPPTGSEGGAERPRGEFRPVNVFVPSLACFFLTAFLILGVATFFQVQLTSLKQELEALRLNFSREEDRPKTLTKRNSEERENGGRGGGSGIEAAHLEGSLPFQHIEDDGRIGPWYLSSTDNFVRLRGKGTEVEISQSGVYYVYAQVYYLTSHPDNSFQIFTYNGTERHKRHRNVVTCSSQGRNSVGDVSCSTGLVVSLKAGQRLYLNQIEQDRVIHFLDGCSYFGFVLLRRNATMKRK